MTAAVTDGVIAAYCRSPRKEILANANARPDPYSIWETELHNKLIKYFTELGVVGRYKSSILIPVVSNECICCFRFSSR